MLKHIPHSAISSRTHAGGRVLEDYYAYKQDDEEIHQQHPVMVGFLLTILVILVVASIAVQIVRIYRKQIKETARDMTSAFELCSGAQEEEEEDTTTSTSTTPTAGARAAWTSTTTQLKPLQPQNHNEYVNMAETAVV
jgi:flagellar biosynthesis/type III secretory pathway M-ring protein FliF/YscJ